MKNEKIVLGGGCFWCTEAVYSRLPGVVSVMPGYAGGETKNPTYAQVGTGRTGHAEVLEVTFDSSVVPLEDILAVFFAMHDPTTLNRQGADTGTQYRSVILWTNAAQELRIMTALQKARTRFSSPIVTEVKQLETFFPAEEEHRRYYDRNQDAPYCSIVIAPKLEKLKDVLRP
ncbi:MAG: peptide-methionine (S)-S-oxide reductase MsrA [Candidatus Peribacteraceae bacterium]|nr:peptide-methionine (S)-S-oxide reductase MsrA [Candidatus Peribacteraceae bacterium]MDD5741962.1 peptide-methionine (S)-S-oxide reductase MsrA [Candidatus Peribacteraceae bacterium]